MKRLTEDELLRLACIYAQQDREGYLDAIAHCRGDHWPETIKKCKRLIKALKEYRIKRWGKTRFEVALEGCKSVDVLPNPPPTR